MKDILLRFVIGGTVVSLFAMLGDVFRPKSFAGLFGAAPSIALATIGLTIASKGKAYAAIEARSMILGALAFCIYAAVVSSVLWRGKFSALKTTVALLPVWFCVALGTWLVLSRLV
ncbi:MAG TPA: DUF3147 family protein [Acidobacteriaceae bacterium]|nr:DUF3147 family protein [Acidobacteriaceae bacterium]